MPKPARRGIGRDLILLEIARHVLRRFGPHAPFLAGQCLRVSVEAKRATATLLCLELIRAIEAVSDCSPTRFH